MDNTAYCAINVKMKPRQLNGGDIHFSPKE